MMSIKNYWQEGGKIAFAYAFAEAIVQWVILKLLHTFAPRKWDRTLKLNISNRCIATLHAIVMSAATIYYWLYLNPSYTISPVMSDHQNLANDLMVGYLFYDTISEIFVMKNLELLMLGHHVVGLASHITCRINNCGACAYYHMMVYLAELSTPFLHVSWILKSCDMKHTTIFKMCVACLLLLFIVVRLLWGPFMQYDLHIRREHWFISESGKALYWPNVVCVLFFNVANFTWGKALFSIALKSIKGNEEDAKENSKARAGKKKD